MGVARQPASPGARRAAGVPREPAAARLNANAAVYMFYFGELPERNGG